MVKTGMWPLFCLSLTRVFTKRTRHNPRYKHSEIRQVMMFCEKSKLECFVELFLTYKPED
jgi:hypothetical protein